MALQRQRKNLSQESEERLAAKAEPTEKKTPKLWKGEKVIQIKSPSQIKPNKMGGWRGEKRV